MFEEEQELIDTTYPQNKVIVEHNSDLELFEEYDINCDEMEEE